MARTMTPLLEMEQMMSGQEGWRQKAMKLLKNIKLASAFLLVYITYNPEGVSYFHWAIRPWMEGLFGKSKMAAAGPHSLKAFLGVTILIGWFIFLRATRRKIGAIGILLTIAFFTTLGWMLMDYGLFPSLGVRMRTHIILLIVSFILMLGVLLPEPAKKGEKPKQDKQKDAKVDAQPSKEPESDAAVASPETVGAKS